MMELSTRESNPFQEGEIPTSTWKEEDDQGENFRKKLIKVKTLITK